MSAIYRQPKALTAFGRVLKGMKINFCVSKKTQKAKKNKKNEIGKRKVKRSIFTR